MVAQLNYVCVTEIYARSTIFQILVARRIIVIARLNYGYPPEIYVHATIFHVLVARRIIVVSVA